MRIEEAKAVKRNASCSGLNVLMISIDSISHMLTQRALPLAYKYFTEDLKVCYLLLLIDGLTFSKAFNGDFRGFSALRHVYLILESFVPFACM